MFTKTLCLSCLMAGLLAVGNSLMAQQAKQPVPPPSPRTEEVREVARPVFEQETQISPEEELQLQQKTAAEAKLKQEQEAAAMKERELESKKVVNPNWRNQKSQEQIIMETHKAEVEALNIYEKELRLKEIQNLENQLLQTTDEGMKTKLRNKIDNLKNHPSENGFAE